MAGEAELVVPSLELGDHFCRVDSIPGLDHDNTLA